MKLSQNTNDHYTYLRKPEILVSWWLVQMENTLFRVWEHWHQVWWQLPELNRLQMENKKRQVEFKDVCNKSNFIHLHDSIAKAANVPRKIKPMGLILTSNVPRHRQQGPQICTRHLRQLSPPTLSLKLTRSNFFKAISAALLWLTLPHPLMLSHHTGRKTQVPMYLSEFCQSWRLSTFL